MGRTVARIFYELSSRHATNTTVNNIPNWSGNTSPYYYNQIPTYLTDIYKPINIEIPCSTTEIKDVGLPNIIMRDEYLNSFKVFLNQSKKYPEKFKIMDEKLKNFILNDKNTYLIQNDLFQSDKYSMVNFHDNEENDSNVYWFCEAIFIDLKNPDYIDILKIF